jgi:predicted transcriptional regulator
MAGIPYDKLTYLSILRGDGLTQAEIANIMGVSQQVVSYELKKKREAYFRKFPEDRL